jgi:hypothetical protein
MKSALFVGGCGRGQVSRRRAELLMRRGFDLQVFDTDRFLAEAGALARQLTVRTQAGPVIERLNRDLAAVVRSLPQDAAVFLDKPVWIRPATVELMRDRRLRTVAYTVDDPFGPRRDGVWRLFIKAIPLYDLHIVPRTISIEDFTRAGAQRVVLKRVSYDPRFHYPAHPPRGEFPLGYSYIGSPYEQRPAFLAALSESLGAAGAKLSVFGPNWMHWRNRSYGRRLAAGPPLWEADYRDAIWSSLACMAFLTRLNRDEISHKAVEIAACGRPPVLEPEELHADLFKDGESAIFFTSVEECSDKLIYYHAHPEKLQDIGLRASQVVRAAGYSEDTLIDLVVQELTS